MQENFLNTNLTYIKKYNPTLAEKIRNHAKLDDDYEINDATSGDPILYKNEVPVNSKIDPIEEAIELFSSVKNNTKIDLCVIFGLALGYTLKRFLKSYKGRIIVYEPNLDFLRITLELEDLSKELSSERIVIIQDIEEFENAYEKLFFLGGEVDLVYSQYHNYRCFTQLEEIVNKINYICGLYQSDYKNLERLTTQWTKSVIASSVYTCRCNEVNDLKDKFKGKSAVIISAGPSLSKYLDFIKEYRDKLVVFCVGTALKKVINQDIKPDFVVIIETWESTLHQIEGIDLSDMNLIVEAITYKTLFETNAKNTFVYYAANDNMTKFICDLWKIDTSVYEAKGTVSLTALYSAKIMGCDKIILIGQDLAYTDGNCYAAGTIYESIKYKLDEKEDKDFSLFSTEEEELASNLKADIAQLHRSLKVKGTQVVKVKGQLQPFVYTPSTMAMFIKHFETTAKELGSSYTLVNSTEGGAYIEGFEHISLKESLAKYTNEIINVEKAVCEVSKLDNKTVLNRISLFLHELYNAKTCFEKIKEVYNSYNGLVYSIQQPIENSEKIDKILVKLRDYYAKTVSVFEQNYIFNNCLIIQIFRIKRFFEIYNPAQDSKEELLTALCNFLKRYIDCNTLYEHITEEIARLEMLKKEL
ncbi:MAG: 6-hydroxymethylpterin diphosphokinase MptE-like protein [Candidatus Gastranaerophilaceae bacterium]|jgi:hypothetical protein